MNGLILEALLLIAGFVLLIKGADIFVNASVGIAKKLKVPTVIIGLTIVAMGTGTPEVVITITASIQGAGALAVSNIVGSNIFNLLFIIGLCALIKALKFEVHQIAKEFWLSIIAAIMLIGLILIGGTHIPRWGGAVLLAVFIVYLILVIRKAKKAQGVEDHSDEEISKLKPMPIIVLLAVLGCGLIVVGGKLVVDNASKIAFDLGVTERIIGLTIVAIGTSLPELITSLVACKKGENEFALGNIIGSSIFNILFILGIAGIINPLEFDSALIFDTIFLIVGSFVALIFVYTSKRLARPEGTVMALMYVGYMVYILMQ